MPEEPETQLATRPSKAPVLADERGVRLQSLEEMWRFAQCAVNSGIYKQKFPTPEVAVIVIQAGLELGLSPVWALSNIYAVHGTPTVFGDALLGIVLAHPDCEDVIETTDGEGDKMVATCEVRRRGRAAVVRRFSVAEAKKAGLWGKAGPWTTYPARMLAMRARSWACRDAFADALRGLSVKEEREDVPQAKARVVTTTMVLPGDESPQPVIEETPVAAAELDADGNFKF